MMWRLRGSTDLADHVTDRSDASGTGYFDSQNNAYRRDLLVAALGHDAVLPRVLGPDERVEWGVRCMGPGAGDNAAAALGVDAGRTVGRKERVKQDVRG